MAEKPADAVLTAMQDKLARYEAAGMTAQVDQVKARIAKREKAAKKSESEPAAEKAAAPLLTDAPAPKGPAVLGAKTTKK